MEPGFALPKQFKALAAMAFAGGSLFAPLPWAQEDPPIQGSPQAAVLNMSVADLRDARVLDSAGSNLGEVAEIIVKEDGSEAGILISAKQGYRYVPLDQVVKRGSRLLLGSRAQASPVTEEELQQAQFNKLPETDRPLSDYIQTTGR